jgi:H+/gluconate symporter-like permease
MVVKVAELIRNGAAGAIIAALPISASVAAVRPNAAVPTAGSTAVASAAQYENGADIWAGAWIPLGIIVATAVVGIILATKDDNGHGNLSFG